MFEGNTQDTTVFAIALPLFWADRYFRWVLPIVLLPILIIKGGASFIVLAGHTLLILSWFWYSWIYRVIILSGVIGAVYFLAANNIIGGSRWKDVWADHLLYWSQNSNVLVGFGPGSYEWISSKLAKQVGFEQYWLHSDWLQFAVETGFIGLAFALLAYFYILWRARWNSIVFQTWVGLGLGMIFYSPIQFFLVQFLAAYLIRETLNEWDQNLTS